MIGASIASGRLREVYFIFRADDPDRHERMRRIHEKHPELAVEIESNKSKWRRRK